MKIAAASDVHAPRYLEEFEEQWEGTPEVEALLLAGDVVQDNDLSAYPSVLDLLPDHLKVYAVFGNQEYEGTRDQYVEAYGDRVNFLRETAAPLGGTQVVGSTGSLDRPTWWQRNNRPERWKVYAERVEEIDRMLSGTESAILLTHYATTYRTLEGEKEAAWPEMGREEFEGVIEKHSERLEAVIHGHAHHGSREAEIAGVPVVNAAVTLGRESLPVLEI